LVSAPYAAVAAQLGIHEDEVIARLAAMQASGALRRIAAVPNHYALGWRANGMTVWDVDDARVDALGEHVCALPFVSHCYPRARPAAVAVQPVRDGACQSARASTAAGGPDRRGPGRRLLRAGRAVVHAHPQEDRPAAAAGLYRVRESACSACPDSWKRCTMA